MVNTLQVQSSWSLDAGGDVADELDTCEGLYAPSIDEDLAAYGEDDLIVNALKTAGGDLWRVTRDLEAGLRREETTAVEEFVRESAEVAELRLQIENCDEVLGTFEELLDKCQTDLGNIAGGVRHMKERADAFDVLSKNRRAAETSLAAWIEAVSIPRGLSKAIHETDVGDALYCQHLNLLQDKLAFVAKKTNERGDMPVSCRNAAGLLQRLRARAVDRIAVHLRSEMRKLEDDNQLLYALTLGQAGKADSNQLLYTLTLGQAGGKGVLQQLRQRQQQLLLSCPLILFLISDSASGEDPAASLYQDVLRQYTEAMRGALASQIRAEYKGYALAGVREVITGRHVLFPHIEASTSRMKSFLSTSAALGSKGLSMSLAGLKGVTKGVVGAAKGELGELRRFNPTTWSTDREPSEHDWALGDRFMALQRATSPHASGQTAAEEEGQAPTPQPPELVLHRLLLSFGELLDNESLVVCRLFPRRSGDELIDMFVPALQVIREAADALIHSTIDPTSLLLMIWSLESSQRKVCDVLCCDIGSGEAFDDFYIWGYKTVWPRFKESVEAQIVSVRAAVFTVVAAESSSEIRLFAQRYAQLSAAFFLIDEHLQAQTAQMARMTLKYIWAEVQQLLSSLGQQMGDGKKGSVLVIDCLHQVLQVYYELGVCASACAPLRQALDEQSWVLLPLVMGERYVDMSVLVVGSGAWSGAADAAETWWLDLSKFDLNEAQRVVIAFKQHWRMDFATTVAFLSSAIASREGACEIAKKGLVWLVLLYARLRRMVQQSLGEGGSNPLLEHFVPEAQLVAEIDKLTTPPPALADMGFGAPVQEREMCLTFGDDERDRQE